MNAQTLSQMAKDYYEQHRQQHPEDPVYENPYPAICGIMSVQAAKLIREAAHIKVEDTDSIELHGYAIMVNGCGLASKLKGSIVMSHFQYKTLLRQMVQDWVGDDIPDFSCVDLSGLED